MPKKKKHPDAPKNAMGSYMWFCQDEREKVKQDMPELQAKEILSELGRRWKMLPEENKVQYNNLAAEDKQRFDREKELFLRTHLSMYSETDTKANKKRKKDPNAPKKPRSNYILFVNDVRPRVVQEFADAGNTEVKQTDIMARVAELWRAADDKTKQKYTSMAMTEKEGYKVRLANYQATLAGGELLDEDEGDEDDDDDDSD